MLGKDAAEHEHVQLGLVVSDEDGGASLVEVALRIDDLEGDTGRGGHEELEAACGGPLRTSTLAEEAHYNSRDETVQRGRHQGDVRRQTAGGERGFGRHGRNGVEGEGEGSVASQEIAQVIEEGHFKAKVGLMVGCGVQKKTTTGNQIVVSIPSVRAVMGWSSPAPVTDYQTTLAELGVLGKQTRVEMR